MGKDRISTAHRRSIKFYDDILTQRNPFARLYIGIFWNVDDNYVAGKVLENIPGDFSGKLLDVPVGTAVFTQRKYTALKEARITCLDYSRDMIEQAKSRFEQGGCEHVSCVRGDVGHMKFEDGSFDLVLSMNGFHAFPNKENAFTETARVLRTGGVFTGCFYIKGERSLTDWVVKQVLARKGWFTPPFMTKTELESKLKYLYSEVDIWNDKGMAMFRCVK